jgi:hypothetical protein
MVLSATRELVGALIASGMDAADAASLVARAGAEMSAGPSNAALRTRRWRENKASQAVTCDDGAMRLDRHKPSRGDGVVGASLNVTERLQTSQNVTRDDSETKSPLSMEENKKEKKEQRGTATRGSRLADDWKPTPIDWALAVEMLGADVSRGEIEKFKDHWKQQPGSKGVKLDWAAAWRNWIRRAYEFRGNRNERSRETRTAGVAGRSQTHGDATLAGLGRIADRVRERGLAERQANLPATGSDDLVGQRSRDGAEPCIALIEAPRPDADHERDFGS